MQHAVYRNGVAVHQLESIAVEVVNGVDRKQAARLADEIYAGLVGIAREAAGVFDERTDTLVLLHFVVHWALHFTRYLHQAFVGFHDNHVARSQAHVALHVAVEDVVVDVAGGNELALAVDADVTERTDFVRTARHVEGVEDGGEGGEGVSAGHDHFAHHVYGDGAGLAHGEAHVGTAVALAEGGLEALVGLRHGESVHADGAVVIDHHGTIGGHGALEAFLRGSPHVDEDGIARPEAVVVGRGNVHVGLKGEVAVVEDVAAEHLFALHFPVHPLILGEDIDVVERVGQNAFHFIEIAGFAFAVVGKALLLAHGAGVHSLLRVRTLVLPLQLAFVAVVGAEAFLPCGAADVLRAHHRTVLLLLVLVANAAYLFDSHTAFNEFRDNFVARRAAFAFLHHELHHLVVGHAGLSHHLKGEAQQGEEQEE